MDRILDLLDKLADTVGKTVEYLWPHAVRYVAIGAISEIAVWVVVVFCAALWLAENIEGDYFYRHNYNNINDIKGPNVKFWALITLLLTGFILAVVLSINVPVVFEPEGYLVTRILRGNK